MDRDRSYQKLLNKLYFYIKIVLLLLLRRVIPEEIIQEDYNSLAPTYDHYFSKYTKPHSQELARKLNVSEGATALDLACGTGIITAELTKYAGSQGKVTAIDSSSGMIQKAKERVSENVEFMCGDMLGIMENLQAGCFDYVTCGWAIGYSDPLQLLKKITRVLKQNGKIGIIENKRDTLAPLRETGIKVMQRYPQHIRYIMDLSLRLPKNTVHLQKLFVKAGLNLLDLWEGEVKFNFKDGAEALDWALHTGASAGFNKIMDSKVRKMCDDAFIEIIEKDYKTDQGINIFHKYVAGIAQKI